MKDYIQQAIRTESRDTVVLDEVAYAPHDNRLLHAAIGMLTEAGEFIDVLKKYYFYDKVPDFTNLKEELGDILWYMAIAMDALGTDFETEMQRNIAKLRTRYPDKFSNENANTRDLGAEREVLEQGVECLEPVHETPEPEAPGLYRG